MNQPETPNRSVIGTFYSGLLRLDIDELNSIDSKDHPKWARRVIDAERRRRKDKGDTAPSTAEKRKILSFGEGHKSNTTTSTGNKPPSNRVSTKKSSKRKEARATRTEVDGEPLHDHVVGSIDYDVSYDKYLSPSKERSLAVFGTLQCPRPDCRNHWVSGICATVLEFSRWDMTYRTTIHSQKCRDCLEFAEPLLDPESYSSRVKWVLDLWTGNRDAVKPLPREGPDGPHEEDLCHACSIDKCPWKSMEE